MTYTLTIRRDTRAEWVKYNPVLALGEPAFVTDEDKFYIGDGITAFTGLQPINKDVVVTWDDVTGKPTFSAVATSGSYNDLTDKPTIPSIEGLATETYVDNAVAVKADKSNTYTKAEADAKFLTEHQSLEGYATEQWVESKNYLTEHQDISGKADKADTYTKTEVNALIPDVSAFITKSVNDLENYYTKSTTYTKAEVDQIVSSIHNLKIEIVSVLPATGDTNTIYLVPKATAASNDVYDEYLYVSNNWEHIGSTEIDLSNYYTKEEVDAKDWFGTQAEYDALAVKDPTVTYHIEGGIVVTWDSITGKPTFSAVATSGSYNDLTDKPTIPTVPTNVSAFTNDAGYLTEHQELKTINNQSIVGEGNIEISGSNDWFGTQAEYDAITTKDPNVTYHIEGGIIVTWNSITGKPTFATVATSGDYNDLINKPTIPTVPTDVSAFNNDAGYLTEHQSLEGYATETWVEGKGYSTFSGSYDDLTNKPTIPTVPTNVSAFTNDAGYLTEHQSIKTINNQTLVGEGNIEIEGGSTKQIIHLDIYGYTETEKYPDKWKKGIDSDLADTIAANYNEYVFQARKDDSSANVGGGLYTYKTRTSSSNYTTYTYSSVMYDSDNKFNVSTISIVLEDTSYDRRYIGKYKHTKEYVTIATKAYVDGLVGTINNTLETI